MSKKMRILLQKIGGFIVLAASIMLAPYAEDITYVIVTVPAGILFLMADFVIGDGSDYEEENDIYYDEWEEL